jgi:hypothetical protein
MGLVYPDVAYGMEGDMPAFLGLIANGMNDPSHPSYGGWGGRFALYTPAAPAPIYVGADGGMSVMRIAEPPLALRQSVVRRI